MKPFLFNEVFAVNPSIAIKDAPVAGIPAVTVDGFLKDPARARGVGGRAPAPHWQHGEGGRNVVAYYAWRRRFPRS